MANIAHGDSTLTPRDVRRLDARMRERPPLTILDANVWLDCFRRPNSEHLRKRLLREVRSGRLRPILTPIVLAELASGYEEGRAVDRESVMRFASNASSARVVIAPHVRRGDEIRLRRPLRESELLADVSKIRDGLMGLDWAKKIAADLKDAHRRNKESQKAYREASLEKLPEDQRDAVLGSPAARLAFALAWAHDDMVGWTFGTDISAASLPDPRKAPSFFAPVIIHIERIARVLIEGRTPMHPGPADTALLADALACGRAVLVTGDGPLLEIARRVQPYFPRSSFMHRDPWFEAL